VEAFLTFEKVSMKTKTKSLIHGFALLRNLGIDANMDDYGKRKLAVFNILNFFGALSGIIIPIAGLFVYTVWGNYSFHLEVNNYSFFLFNHFLAALFIFCSLYLFKKENHGYQSGLLVKNVELQDMNVEMAKQKNDIYLKAELLEKQANELRELDAVKNKLFSIICHDLRSPMYALRNLFRNVQKFDLPGEEIKLMIPDVVTDLNYTTGLMENLLQWARSQMQADVMRPQILDITQLIQDVTRLLRLQADSKQVYLETKVNGPVYIYADKDMINLVLRNLLSNAIKFTGEKGTVIIGAYESSSFVEVFVQDTGTGMTTETMKKLNENNFFTTKGTANESGTGLGLMLCKEFLARNGGHMHVESEQGKGSTFSFTLPAKITD
jgi:two-component system sensor histidine kinase/response regulator